MNFKELQINHITPEETPASMTNMDSAAIKSTDSSSSKEIDPVCKMKVDKSVIDKSAYKGKTYYFCSPYCKNEFDQNPEKYIGSQNST
jgi:YHS domain-containing protein